MGNHTLLRMGFQYPYRLVCYRLNLATITVVKWSVYEGRTPSSSVSSVPVCPRHESLSHLLVSDFFRSWHHSSPTLQRAKDLFLQRYPTVPWLGRWNIIRSLNGVDKLFLQTNRFHGYRYVLVAPLVLNGKLQEVHSSVMYYDLEIKSGIWCS